MLVSRPCRPGEEFAEIGRETSYTRRAPPWPCRVYPAPPHLQRFVWAVARRMTHALGRAPEGRSHPLHGGA